MLILRGTLVLITAPLLHSFLFEKGGEQSQGIGSWLPANHRQRCLHFSPGATGTSLSALELKNKTIWGAPIRGSVQQLHSWAKGQAHQRTGGKAN